MKRPAGGRIQSRCPLGPGAVLDAWPCCTLQYEVPPRLPRILRPLLAPIRNRLLPLGLRHLLCCRLPCGARLGAALRLGPLVARQSSAGAGALPHVEAEDIRKIATEKPG